MTLLTGMTEDGQEVPVQVKPDGKLVAEGLTGPQGVPGQDGATGPQGVKGDKGDPGDPAAISGTAALPGLTPVGDPDTGLYSPGADHVAISTGGAGRLFVTSDGKVGVGTTSPGARLEVAGSIRAKEGSGHLNIAHDGVNGSIINTAGQLLLYANSSNDIIAHTNSLERARIDSSGRLLVGRSTEVVGSAAKLQASTTANLAAVATYADNTAAKAGGLVAGDIYRTAAGQLMITF